MKQESKEHLEGFSARADNRPATDNPYRKLTKQWSEWADGWKDRDAAQGDQL